ncbi:MAG: tetratricopeptide repeat protein [Winogradskyella sp.]|uniref:tetratricopeptide repeat protein n=1 Tax=Winogradskyella sp. TaxID=1883156 RepID=UPI0017EDCD99|nr:tetratricopeptide repeat protein [Winogradskyella sp.]MBT8246105.1 tetratricopeptide repeat protein [Winogradskyella sp.]NNK22991.1 tetratricopeptide repeat protein [Winogradskyella sp.]
MNDIKTYSIILALIVSAFGFSQDFEKERKMAEQKSKDLVYEANALLEKDDFVSAEMEYRKAISKQKDNVAGVYNLAHSYYKKGNFDEALFRTQEAANNAETKEEKHRAFHNIGNILMQNKKCKEAVEAFKNALRSNPSDEETRYNFALAKECAEQQKDQDGGGEDNKEDQKKEDQKDKDKEKENKEEQDKDKEEEEGDKDKKKGDDKKDEDAKSKDEKKDDGKGDKEKPQQKPKQQPGKMSPQQIKNILEAMNNQEQKVQEKINAKKQKGARVKTEKDW